MRTAREPLIALLPALLSLAALPAAAAAGPADASDQAVGGAPPPEPAAVDSIRPDRSCPADLEVLLPRELARSSGRGAGDTVSVRPSPEAAACEAAVAGVYVPRADPARLTVRRPRLLFHLPHLARLAGREGEADRFSVGLRRGVEPDSAADRLAGLLPGARVLPTGEVVRASSTTFEVVRRFHRAIAAITLVAGGVFLACIMILKVEERRAPVAALRLVGVSRRTLLGWIALETALVALLGGALGVGVGRLAVWVVNRVYQAVYDTELVFALLTPEATAVTLATGALLGLGAGLVAAGRLFALEPLEEVGR